VKANRPKIEPIHDDDYWTALTEYLERRDRGERVDPEEYAARFPALADRLRDCLAGFHWLEGALSGSSVEAASAAPAAPAQVGDYRIVREIGRGGMGVVYEAVHQTLDRRVALKVLFDAALQDAVSRERFLREARTAATLHHTNIVPVFDVGATDRHLYFSMQLIEGRNLSELQSGAAPSTRYPAAPPGGVDVHAPTRDATRAAAQRDGADAGRSTPNVTGLAAAGRLPAARRAAAGPGPAIRCPLDPQVAAGYGLQAAEALAYAHARGIVHRDIKPSNLIVDHSGGLWITDFGLARRVGDPTVTASGATLGTPRYMSPEQASAAWDTIDARTDVYSLGATLFELLTARPLYGDSSPQQILIQILRADPPRPRSLNDRIPRDLETIVLRAMARRPADRYESAQALADDLRRFLACEPVRARRIGPAGRFVRWCRREPRLAAVVTTSLAAIAMLVAVYQVHLVRERRVAVAASAAARTELADSLLQQATVLVRSGELGARWLAMELLQRSAELRPRPDVAVQAVRTLSMYNLRAGRDVTALGSPATAAAFDPSSPRLAVAVTTKDGPAVCLVRVEGTNAARPAAALPEAAGGGPPELRAAGTGAWDESQLPAPEPVHALAFSPDGSLLAASTERRVCLWDMASGQLRILPGPPAGLSTVAFSRDGRFLAGCGGGICLWDVESGTLLRRVREAAGASLGLVAFSADGRTLVSALGDGTQLERFALRDGAALDPLRWRAAGATAGLPALALAAAPRGPLVAAACGDERVRIWDLDTGELRVELSGHRAPVLGLAFSADGEQLVSTDGFGIKLWDVQRGSELATLADVQAAPSSTLASIAWSRDGRWLATGGPGGARLWELATPVFHRVVATHERALSDLATSGNGRWAAWAGAGALYIHDLASDTTRSPVAIAAQDAVSLAFSHDGRRLVTVGRGTPPIQWWDVAMGKLVDQWPGEPASAVAMHPAKRRIAVAHLDGVIRLWDSATAQPVSALVGHASEVTRLAFSRDGRWLAAGTLSRGAGDEPTVHLWDLASARRVHALHAHPHVAFAVAFDPGGRQLVTGGGDGVVRLWDVESGRLRQALRGHRHPVHDVAFSPDGTRLAAAGLDGRLLVWDVPRGGLLADVTAQRAGSLSRVAFRDSQSLWAAGGPREWVQTGMGYVERWDLAGIARDLAAWGLDGDGNRVALTPH
jgi:WD40 repeat protein/serine/threonine protein kinase